MKPKNIIRLENKNATEINKMAEALMKFKPGVDNILITNEPGDIWYCEKKNQENEGDNRNVLDEYPHHV